MPRPMFRKCSPDMEGERKSWRQPRRNWRDSGVFIHTVPVENLARFERAARRRLEGRDEEDWPYLALALLLECPVWTEDTDFFGTGVAVWDDGPDRVVLR